MGYWADRVSRDRSAPARVTRLADPGPPSREHGPAFVVTWGGGPEVRPGSVDTCGHNRGMGTGDRAELPDWITDELTVLARVRALVDEHPEDQVPVIEVDTLRRVLGQR
jgi:hypothetical protein